jgi:rhodanese-related sulfurtransferase
MSPDSARRAENLGYTNVKVYADGIPAWIKTHHLVLSSQFLKEAWIDKDIAHVLVDVRPAKDAEAGFIKGAVSVPVGDIEKSIAKFPPKDKKAPIMIYDQKGGDDAVKAAKALIAAGYAPVDIVTGGFDAWKAAGYPVQTGKLAENIVYVPKPRPGEIAVDDFKKLAAHTPADTLILDVRDSYEGNEGMIKGAKLIPDDQILDRLAEVPKDKKIITYCANGVRAEMAYHKLKDKGYNVQFLNAKMTIDKAGNFNIEKP